jgi:hypothetical protein
VADSGPKGSKGYADPVPRALAVTGLTYRVVSLVSFSLAFVFGFAFAYELFGLKLRKEMFA